VLSLKSGLAEDKMSTYTVHEPLLAAGAASPDPERFLFVRDGFSIWAFLLTPVWMLWRRMWLVFVVYVVAMTGVLGTALLLGASRAVVALIGVLISLLVGLEASTLRRVSLSNSGWRNVGIVSGDKVEDAERRFFDAWLREGRTDLPTPPRAASEPSAMAGPRLPQAPRVIGLFPEPGASPGAGR